MTVDTPARVSDDVQKQHNERWTQGTIDPMEAEAEALLQTIGLAFTRPDRDSADPANLDFFVTAWGSYLELKRYHTPRIAEQLSRVPEDRGAIVLQGRPALALLTTFAAQAERIAALEAHAQRLGEIAELYKARAEAAESSLAETRAKVEGVVEAGKKLYRGCVALDPLEAVLPQQMQAWRFALRDYTALAALPEAKPAAQAEGE